VNPLESTATRCPLCGNDNACGAAAGQSTCWCFSADISPEALAQVPADQQGLACVCAQCAAKAKASLASEQAEEKKAAL
jgi:hypothetical protein